MPGFSEPVYPLEKDEFIAALASGHGRALIHAGRCGTDGVGDAILDAALFPKVYDTQCNGYGEKWLARLCNLAGLVDTIISRDHGIEGDHGGLRCSLLKEFALQGHPAARSALREMCRYDEGSGDFPACFEIVEVEGEEGFIFAADRIGGRVLEDPDYWMCPALVSMLDEKAGEGRAMALLEQESPVNPRIAAYREALLAMATRSGEREKPPRPTTGEIIKLILTSPKLEPRMRLYGKNASLEERLKVAELDISKMEPQSLENFLSYFCRTGFPRFRDEYIALLRHPDERVGRRAIWGLSHHSEPPVRAAAYEALERGEVESFVQLLRSSGLPEDTDALLRAIDAPEILEDIDERHSVGSDLLDLVETNPAMTDVRLAEWIYRFSPCMICRHGAVKVMIDRSVLPEWMAGECLADADECIRDLASKYKGVPGEF